MATLDSHSNQPTAAANDAITEQGTAVATEEPGSPDQSPHTKKSYLVVLETWQNTSLFDDRVTFHDAVESLSDAEQVRFLEAKPGTGYKASTWTLFNKKTNREAVFVHAAVWLSNTDLYTGNFVPRGEEAPVHVQESRIQDTVNFKCDISYILNTEFECSMYTNLEILEDYIKALDGFNRSNRPRSNWQDGTNKKAYTISSKLFVKKASKPKEPDFEPHEWLLRGLKEQKKDEFAINPDRPYYFDLVNNTAIKLENSDIPRYEAGDVVWFAFKVSFFIAQKYWTSEVVPLEFMRVARVSEFETDRPDEDGKGEGERTSTLQDGISIEYTSREQEPMASLKRKHADLSDTETISSASESAYGGEPGKKDADGKHTLMIVETKPRQSDHAEQTAKEEPKIKEEPKNDSVPKPGKSTDGGQADKRKNKRPRT